MTDRTAPRLRARRVLRNQLGVPRQAIYSLQWDLLAGIFAGIYMGSVFPFITRIARTELHASNTALAVLSAAPFVGNLLAPIWAQRMDGRAKMPFVLGSWIPARLLLLLMPLVAAAAPFVGLMSALQFLGAFSSPAYTTLMKDIYPDNARGKLMGYVRVGVQSMSFLGAMATGYLMDHGTSFRIVFPIAGVCGIAAALAFSQVRPLRPDDAPPPQAPGSGPPLPQSLRILRENVPYRWFAASVMVYGFGNLMAVPLYSLFQVERLHITNSEIAHLTNIASLSSIAASFFWGRYLDRFGPPRTVFLSILCVAGIGVVYQFTRTIEPLYVAAVLSGIGFAGVELGYLASILEYSEPGKAARYQALHSLLLGIRGVTAPTLGLKLLPYLGYEVIFGITLSLMVVGALLQLGAARAAPPRSFT